ncbi:MAG: hypothetical protein HKN36_07975 [Hellea sp.]|nr:hypothetical protein [Hellea sp.]
MTETFDKWMIKAGFDAREISQVNYRIALYWGILSMAAITGLFLTLIVV